MKSLPAMMRQKGHTVVALAATALLCYGFFSCTDDYSLDDKGNYPPGYGMTLYKALQNPSSAGLSGTFSTYLKIIDDLGYATTMDGEASSTIFPANDEAFERFFKSNSWNVSSYNQLSTTQKRILLYSSMLDNPMLVEMLSNVENGETSYTRGQAIKHYTRLSATDSISHYYLSAATLPHTKYWSGHFRNGIDLVSDGTAHAMVHFTPEQMTTNQITTSGNPSDFEVITGEPYDATTSTAYVFRDKIIVPDVNCKNGYIHQMENVVVDPGNMAEVVRGNSETSIFSSMLDRFSAPYYNSQLTQTYNNNARQLGTQSLDSIFERRYFSEYSQGRTLAVSPTNEQIPSDELLPFDPGWNAYYTSNIGSNHASEIGCMFVPTNEALVNYFTTEGGGGKFIIDQFRGSTPNTAANLKENLAKVPANIVCAFLKNLMKTSFNASVPSKFDYVLDDAGNPMALSLGYLHRTTEGKYDVEIANNGVIYVLNQVIAPATYRAVSAPAMFNSDMKVMNWLIQDKTYLNQNFYAYLLAMEANYVLFIPDDKAFSEYYIDPACYNRTGRKPRALKFWYDAKSTPALKCTAYPYDRTTGDIDTSDSTVVSLSTVTSQLADVLNYHTLVLGSSEEFGSHAYYKTKHGGEIYYNKERGTVASGATYNAKLPTAHITLEQSHRRQSESGQGNNGTTYRLDRVICPPMNSVYLTLEEKGFTKFLNYCKEASSSTAQQVLSDLGYSSSEQKRFRVFVSQNGMDYNVNYFNTYNYTVYAPSDACMDYALAHGLPTWEQIAQLIDEARQSGSGSTAYQTKMAQAKEMVQVIDNFIRYHFQDNAIYADHVSENGEYETAALDSRNRHVKIKVVAKGNDALTITDANGTSQTITATNGKKTNIMARDYQFTSTNGIETSSFAVVHEIEKPLNYGSKYLQF